MLNWWQGSWNDWGLERKLPITLFAITLLILGVQDWNFDTIWVPLVVTSDMNFSGVLPILSQAGLIRFDLVWEGLIQSVRANLLWSSLIHSDLVCESQSTLIHSDLLWPSLIQFAMVFCVFWLGYWKKPMSTIFVINLLILGLQRLIFWHNMGAYSGNLWYEFHHTVVSIVWVTPLFVCFWKCAKFAHRWSQWICWGTIGWEIWNLIVDTCFGGKCTK